MEGFDSKFDVKRQKKLSMFNKKLKVRLCRKPLAYNLPKLLIDSCIIEFFIQFSLVVSVKKVFHRAKGSLLMHTKESSSLSSTSCDLSTSSTIRFSIHSLSLPQYSGSQA